LIAAIVAGAVLVAIPTVISLSRPANDGITRAGEQVSGANAAPWWEEDGARGGGSVSTAPSPYAVPSPGSSEYVIVGPEVSRRVKPTPPKPVVQPAKPRPARPGFIAVAGDHCLSDASKGFRLIGAFSDGRNGWYGRSRGGWDSDGCSGAFTAIPMSGDPRRDDTSASAVWWFKTGPVRAGSCVIGVYVPSSPESRDVAGKPAFYNVVASGTDLTRTAGFAVDQTRNRGRWVNVGTYPLRGGQIGVQLLTRGADRHGEHLAAAQARVACRAA
jgi:translation initiation factor IF-2